MKFLAKRSENIPLKLILFVNYIFILLLLLAYLSLFIDPSVFPYLALLGIAYLPLLLTNILFILFWLYFSPLRSIYSIVTIAIGWSILLSHFQFNKKQDSTPESLKIITYNVHNFYNYLPDKNHPNSQQDSIQIFFQKESPDIVCLQEFFPKDKILINDKKRFGRKIGLKYFHYKKYLSQKHKAKVGLVTYSKYPILKEDFIEYQHKTIGLITKILRGKDTIAIYNLHLASLHFGGNDYRFLKDIKKNQSKEEIKEGSSRIIHKMLNAYRIRAHETALIKGLLKQTQLPIILCGDFNDTPLSYTYHEFSELLEDSFCEAGRGIASTFTAPYLPPIRIDYILHTKEFKTTNFKLKKIEFSDHYPIISNMQIGTD